MSYTIDYSNGDSKVKAVLTDDANVEEVVSALSKIVGKKTKKKKEVTEDVTTGPQVLMEQA